MSTVGELSCDNCGVGYGADDIFCENCGYDFITGSLPSGDESVTPPIVVPTPAAPPEAPAAADPATGDAPVTAGDPAQEAASNGGAVLDPTSGPAVAVGARVTVAIDADRSYFDAVVSEGELNFPDPAPSSKEIELASEEVHVGRTSESRAIHPDLDISDLTGDPAVSSRHAVIRVGDDGAITVTDIGSTNGTFVGEPDSEAIEVGTAIAVDPGTPIFVGAWTKLVITPAES